MQLEQIKVPCRDGAGNVGKVEPTDRFEVEAEVLGNFAVHPSVVGFAGQRRLSRMIFTLTHIPTGGAVSTILPSKEAALWLHEQIKGLTDWKTFSFKSGNYQEVKVKVIHFTEEAIDTFTIDDES